MERKTRAFRPQATTLEFKRLLSLTATPAPETAEVSILTERSGTTPAAVVTSTVRGRYAAGEDNRAADAPLHVRLNGNGRVDGIGRARLSGALDLGGFRVTGSQDVSGTLVLSNARGSVRLQLAGSGGFNPVPNGRFVTTVSSVKGTGAYAGFQRTGTVLFQFGPARSMRGAVTVTLSLKPLVN